jgi:hypothetical protein
MVNNKKTSPWTKKTRGTPSQSSMKGEKGGGGEGTSSREGPTKKISFAEKRPSSTPSQRPGEDSDSFNSNRFGNENTHFFQLRYEAAKGTSSSVKGIGSSL